MQLVFEQVRMGGDRNFGYLLGGTSTEELARITWDSLQRLVRTAPDEATVWPGHDYEARPSSTLALEKKTNPFLLCADVGAFLDLRKDWSSLKEEHGLK